MQLLLFDIDGTLIQISGLGRAMLDHALTVVYGASGPIDSYSFAGKTDRRMARELASAAGVSDEAILDGLPALYREMTAEGERLFSRGSLAPCPGVDVLLEALAARSDVTLGLLTGNIQATAQLKLQAAGINPALFMAGAYGSDSDERNDLLPIAQRRAGARAGWHFDWRNTTVIGDTLADIACAQAGGARSVAVGTGSGTVEALQACQPDIWFEQLDDFATVMTALTTPAHLGRRTKEGMA